MTLRLSFQRAAVGVDVGGTKCLGVRVDATGNIVARHRLATPSRPGELVERVIEVLKVLREPGDAIGVGVPGLVDRDGNLAFGPNVKRVANLPVAQPLRDHLGPRVTLAVENDATCHAWAESMLGSAVDVDHAILVTLGTGIGGGLIINGVPFVGHHGYAGEFGHQLIDSRGVRCTCGRDGCWETVASGRALGRFGREAAQAGEAPAVVERAGGDPENVRGEHVTSAAVEGDPGALAILDTFSYWVGVGLANLTQVFDPECIILGGGVLHTPDVVLPPVRRALERALRSPQERQAPPVVAATFGPEAGAVGAALLAATRPGA